MKLRHILSTIHSWVPPETAQSYDNVGLQVGDPDAEVNAGLVALDLTPQVVDEAIAGGMELIVTHHPILFKGLKRVDASDFIGRMVHRLISNGIAVVAAHTNLDSARDGVSTRLAELLGIGDLTFLEPLPADLVKLVTHVPANHADEIRTALTKAANWVAGPYTDNAFEIAGHGYFRPLDGANPYVGKADGEIQKVDERKIELTVPARRLAATIQVLKAVHPYETIAYDVFRLDLPSIQYGLGMIGVLDSAMALSAFLDRVVEKLGQPAVRYVGDPAAHIERVAVCGGAGRDLLRPAMKQGADAFVTADLSYHNFFDVLGADGKPVMALIDAGHYETEAATEVLLVEWLEKNVGDVTWSRTKKKTSPIRYHNGQ
jgi:dinuclear metal center YbgI/SA1388 family protein